MISCSRSVGNMPRQECRAISSLGVSYLVLAASLLVALPGPIHAQESDGVTTNSAAPKFDIQPMTQVNEAEHLGYFGDPYPIHLAPWLEQVLPQYFSGTTSEILQCQRPIKPECFSATPITVTPGDEISEAIKAAGTTIYDQINHNIYQDLNGKWQMAVTLYVRENAHPAVHWTVIAHAHPDDPASLIPPTTWIADTILAGSLSQQAFANYDGKYFEDEGQLYLIYSKRLISKPVEHDGVVALKMNSVTQPSSAMPVVLLDPSDVNNGFNSEYFHTVPPAGDTFKLIETGNITKIAGKYVMAYSAGDYQQLDYKTGVAFSDTLLPEEGKTYRRVLQEDTNGVWGQPGHLEVHYLLQSQKSGWPNYIASQVIGPGVPSIVQEPSGQYYLYFDGFLPTNIKPAPQDPNNPFDIEADLRRPFFVPLKVTVPANGTVSSATDEELASWITPQSK